MVTSRQQQEIRKRMRRVKDAINDESKNEDDVKRETAKLYDYLHKEGLVQQNV